MKLLKEKMSLLCVLYLVEGGIVVSQLMGWKPIISLCFMLTFVLVGCLFIGYMWKYAGGSDIRKLDFHKEDVILLITILCAGINILISLRMNQGAFSVSYLKKYIMFCVVLVFLWLVSKLETEQKLKDWLIAINTVIAALMVVIYIIHPDNLYMINGIVSAYLTFGMDNPNLTAVFCLCMMPLLFAGFKQAKDKRIKGVYIFLLGALGYFILLTQSRNCMLALAIAVLVYAADYLLKNRVLDNKIIIFGLVIWPLVFVLLYYLILGSDGLLSMFSFLDFGEGKRLDSRLKMWNPAIEMFRNSPIVGAYYDSTVLNKAFNMHNTHLDILISYGILPFAGVMYFIYKVFIQVLEKCKENKNYIFWTGALILYMVGMGESVITSGGQGIYLYLGAYLLLAKSGKEENERKN